MQDCVHMSTTLLIEPAIVLWQDNVAIQGQVDLLHVTNNASKLACEHAVPELE